MVADSSLAKAISVSLLVGQTGLPNLTQKIMNCFKLLLWLRLVPSAYIMDCESLASSSSELKWSSAAWSCKLGVGGEKGGLGGGEGWSGVEDGFFDGLGYQCLGWTSPLRQPCGHRSLACLAAVSTLGRPGPEAPCENKVKNCGLVGSG